MAKLRAPLFGFSAQGSVGGSVSYRRRGRDTVGERKPAFDDVRSRAQLYHRWVYQDYALQWTLMSPATKAVWEGVARGQNITGFNAWMRSVLGLLPDVEVWWRLDDLGVVGCPDYSPQGRNGVVMGASPGDGVFWGAAQFDGVDDYIRMPVAVSTPPMSHCLGFRADTLPAGYHQVVGNLRGVGENLDQGWQIGTFGNSLRVRLGRATGYSGDYAVRVIHTDTWYYFELSFSGTVLNVWVNGSHDVVDQGHEDYADWNQAVYMASIWGGGAWLFKGRVDDWVWEDRVISDELIEQRYERWSARL